MYHARGVSLLAASIALLPWLRMQQLENFGSSLLWTLTLTNSYFFDAFEKKRKRSMNHETGQYMDTVKDNFQGSYLTSEERKKNNNPK
ncbi:unnamed protein product [Rotaria sp. Silwood2]|nr:unnamed protein product [Rotaria sp. Silwood2]CAF3402403.1 unnamed protein product [Rotaria sp. Silwood2]CAF4423319.1 unnamed protein product [Rotaria sp. Silwood2]CAF4615046.1 unnamed protein product [Rotaria sp. Silwood2]CAF4625938.1 unnamed protein product [Rotaria sp. Silwood2]